MFQRKKQEKDEGKLYTDPEVRKSLVQGFCLTTVAAGFIRDEGIEQTVWHFTWN